MSRVGWATELNIEFHERLDVPPCMRPQDCSHELWDGMTITELAERLAVFRITHPLKG